MDYNFLKEAIGRFDTAAFRMASCGNDDSYDSELLSQWAETDLRFAEVAAAIAQVEALNRIAAFLDIIASQGGER